MESASQPSSVSSALGPEREGAGAPYFAPAGRDAVDEFARKKAAVAQVPLLAETLNAMPHMVMVLTARRQIVAANESLLGVLGLSAGQVTGGRPGEAIGCIRAAEGPDGCGTARHCSACGALGAVLESQEAGQKVVRECRILVKTPGGTAPMDLRVTATPFDLDGDVFVVVAVEDISQSKRLAVLQRTFFHDVLNTAGCIQGYARLLSHKAPSETEMCLQLRALSEQIVAEIQSQRDLLAAEAGDYAIQPVPLTTRRLLEDLCAQYGRHPIAEGRTLATGRCWEGVIVSDEQLLLRVLGNMVRNALEATSPGGTVTVACAEAGSAVRFTVHNAAVMPEAVQLQVFQRSFSTKGESGRGIGTYSMKLFGEAYLGGQIGFTSASPEGTTFHLTLPKRLSVSHVQPAPCQET